MIDIEKLKQSNSEKCLNCGGSFNKILNVCEDCKSKDNTRMSRKALKRHKAIKYINADINNKHVLIATLKDSDGDSKKIIVTPNSQIANRVISNIDSGITDFLEEGLMNQKLIDYSLFRTISIGGEECYILKSIM